MGPLNRDARGRSLPLIVCGSTAKCGCECGNALPPQPLLQPEAANTAAPARSFDVGIGPQLLSTLRLLDDALSAAIMSNPTPQTYQWPSKTVKSDYPVSLRPNCPALTESLTPKSAHRQ